MGAGLWALGMARERAHATPTRAGGLKEETYGGVEVEVGRLARRWAVLVLRRRILRSVLAVGARRAGWPTSDRRAGDRMCRWPAWAIACLRVACCVLLAC